MEKDLPQNHYFIDVKNQQIPEDILRVFAEFFFMFGRFPGNIPIVPMRETPNFVKESNIISPSWLYWNFNYGDMRGLVSMHFLAAINIYFGGNGALSKNVIS